MKSITYSTVCPLESFGSDCSKRCHCRDTSPCGFESGMCWFGCKKGWHGEACNQSKRF